MLFFSSSRRHTRYIGDWSSDVCSSDLVLSPWILSFMREQFLGLDGEGSITAPAAVRDSSHGRPNRRCGQTSNVCSRSKPVRSEERRVGKECRMNEAAIR